MNKKKIIPLLVGITCVYAYLIFSSVVLKVSLDIEDIISWKNAFILFGAMCFSVLGNILTRIVLDKIYPQ